MAKKDDAPVIIWPAYFDIDLTRVEGRRVRKKIAFEDPTVEAILKVAKKLGYQAAMEKEYSYPKFWYKETGRVIIYREKKESKQRILKKIGLARLKLEQKKQDVQEEA